MIIFYEHVLKFKGSRKRNQYILKFPLYFQPGEVIQKVRQVFYSQPLCFLSSLSGALFNPVCHVFARTEMEKVATLSMFHSL